MIVGIFFLIVTVFAGTYIDSCDSRWGLNECIYIGIDPSISHRREIIFSALDTIIQTTRTPIIYSNVTIPDRYNDIYGPGIVFTLGESCASPIGKQTRGQYVYLTNDCNKASVMHETMHAFGILHEHIRPDRDNYITVHYENIDPIYKHNFDIVQNSLYSQDYDYSSVMHYGEYYFSINGEKTIDSNGNSVGVADTLSSLDILTIPSVLIRCNGVIESRTCKPCQGICRNGECDPLVGRCECYKNSKIFYSGNLCEIENICNKECQGGYCNEFSDCTCFQTSKIHYIGSQCQFNHTCNCKESGGLCNMGFCECFPGFSGNTCQFYYVEPFYLTVIKILIALSIIPIITISIMVLKDKDLFSQG